MPSLLAASLFILLALFVTGFQLALVAGAPWGELTLGGKFPGRIPQRMRIVPLVSALVLVGFALVVAVRAGLVFAEWQGRARTIVWIVVAYCVVGVLANGFTQSRKERRLWLPTVAMMLVCSVVVALS